jgi:SAM-dependent methyltransferase
MWLKEKIFNFSRNFVNQFGYDIVKKQNRISPDKKAGGHPLFLKEANSLNMDVNDYQESELGFLNPLPLLEEIVYPLIDNFQSPKIVDLGTGTGRWARHITKKLDCIGRGELILVDHSLWITEFLKNYFQSDSKVKVYQCDGFVLPAEIKDSSVDIIFSANTFIYLGIYFFYTYFHDFFRVLNKGAIAFLIF